MSSSIWLDDRPCRPNHLVLAMEASVLYLSRVVVYLSYEDPTAQVTFSQSLVIYCSSSGRCLSQSSDDLFSRAISYGPKTSLPRLSLQSCVTITAASSFILYHTQLLEYPRTYTDLTRPFYDITDISSPIMLFAIRR